MISFIIPTKNEETVLEKTLQAIAAYSGPKEIVISDGGSKDATLAIARRFTDKIAVYDAASRGGKRQTIAEGKNDGAALASGDFLMFIDADVTIPDADRFFEKALGVFERDSRIVGMTVFYRVLPELATLMDRIVFFFSGVAFIIQNNIFHNGGSGGEFQLVRAEAFRKIGGFDASLPVAEDQDLFWRLNKRVGRTRMETGLHIYHTGRRAHKVGWPKLLWQWWANWVSAFFFKKAVSSEWKEIR